MQVPLKLINPLVDIVAPLLAADKDAVLGWVICSVEALPWLSSMNPGLPPNPSSLLII